MQSRMVELNVLRAPGKEEFTRITFYRDRSYVDWDRSDGWTRHAQSRDSLIVLDSSHASELPDADSRAPEMAPVYLAPGETLKLRVFIDRSVVEVFANGRRALAARVYPGRPDSTGVSLLARGSEAELLSLDVWEMRSVWKLGVISR
jgi:beta-fructofuranosidase